MKPRSIAATMITMLCLLMQTGLTDVLGQELLFYDNFQEFTNGTVLVDGASYTAPNAYVEISLLPTSTLTMTNLLGSIRALYNCPATSDMTHWNSHFAYFASPQSNKVLEVTWQLWIKAVKPGGFGLAGLGLPITGDDESIVMAFNDGGEIYGITNVLSGPSDFVTIGNWSSLAGTIMTNRIVLNYPARTMTFSLNGNVLATLPMRPDLIQPVGHMNFEFDELTAYGSTGNQFALDEVQVVTVAPEPVISWDAHESKTRPDGKLMLVWDRLTNGDYDGALSLWRLSNAGEYETSTSYGPYPDWWLTRFDVGPDNKTWLLWDNYANDQISLWRMSTDGALETAWTFGPYDGWWIDTMRIGADGKVRLLWKNYYDNRFCLWRVSSTGSLEDAHTYGPYEGWNVNDIRLGPDNKGWLLWEKYSGTNSAPQVSLWQLNSADVLEAANNYGPYDGWWPQMLDIGPDGKPRLLWGNYYDESASLWLLSTNGVYETAMNAGPYTNWYSIVGLARPDNKTMLGWGNYDGSYSLWLLNSTLGYELSMPFGPYVGWEIWGGNFDTSSKLHLLWKKDDGQISLWRLSPTLTLETATTFGPY